MAIATAIATALILPCRVMYGRPPQSLGGADWQRWHDPTSVHRSGASALFWLGKYYWTGLTLPFFQDIVVTMNGKSSVFFRGRSMFGCIHLVFARESDIVTPLPICRTILICSCPMRSFVFRPREININIDVSAATQTRLIPSTV